jgi:C4-dicarboxylate transporter DctM subunit
LSIPFIVFIGIYSGYTTVTESAGLAAVVSVLVAIFFYKEVQLSQIFEMATEAMKSASAVTFIVMFALLFAHWITGSGVPSWLVNFAVEMDLEKWQFLLILNFMMVLLGMFLDAVAVMLIVTPLILPVLEPLGIDPVHFGIVLIVNMEIAFLTPPIGLNLFVLSSISKAPMGEAVRGMIPFILVMVLFLLLITYIPEISLWLPTRMMN